MPKFSLLLCTINRHKLVRACVDSIYAQHFQDYEIIIVDQSDVLDDDLQKDQRLLYIHIKPRGLSNARNVGLQHATGDYIALIDDDAVYDVHFLQYANATLQEKTNIGILAGRGQDKETGVYLLKGMVFNTEKEIDTREVFNFCISSTLVLHRDVLKNGFDEEFGIGARYNAAEETDIVFSCIDSKGKIYYNPKMMIYHPSGMSGAISIDKAYKYSIGIGAVLKKHYLLTNRTIYLWLFVWSIIRSIGGCFYYLVGKKEYLRSKYTLSGKIKGFMMYRLPTEKKEFSTA